MKIQDETLYLKDFKKNENDGDKIYLPGGYADITAKQASPGKITISATYEKKGQNGTTTSWVNVVLEDTSWSLEKVGGWVEKAKNEDGLLTDTQLKKLPIYIK